MVCVGDPLAFESGETGGTYVKVAFIETARAAWKEAVRKYENPKGGELFVPLNQDERWP